MDAVFETVGEATWAHSMQALKPGGVIVVSGSTSGPAPSADLQRLFFLQLRVIGSTMGTRDELANLLTFVANAGITPEIGLELPMEKADGRLPGDARRRHRRKDRLHALRPPLDGIRPFVPPFAPERWSFSLSARTVCDRV